MMNNMFGKEGTVRYVSRLLSFAINLNTEDVARNLVERFGSIDRITSATEGELLSVDGMTRGAVTLLKITSAVTSRRITDSLELGKPHTEQEIKDYLVGLYHGASVETVYMLLLDGEGCIFSVEYMGEGTVAASDVYPRKLLETAIRRRASAVILAHNHPRGAGTPSMDDVRSTEKLFRLFRNAGVELCAHYIVSGRECGSVDLSEFE